MDGLLIGQMAKVNRVTEQTLRHYDKIGLLKPHYIDESNNYRYYHLKQCARLDMIQNMKSFGMSLDQIKAQLDKQDVTVIQSLLEKEKAKLEIHIKDINLTKKAVERTIENFKRHNNAPKDGTIVLEQMPKRKIYAYYVDTNFYDHDLATYELILRELKQHIMIKELPMVYFCNVGTILRKEKLNQREFVSHEIFIFVDEDFSQSKDIERLEENTYLCIYCDSFHKEKAYANRLMDEIERKGYHIVGDYICEVIADLPIFVDNERGMSIKIQIPIKIK